MQQVTEAVMPKLEVISGATKFVFENDSVENVADLLEATRDILNLPSGATVSVDGAPASPTTPLRDGQQVQVNKPTGSKGK